MLFAPVIQVASMELSGRLVQRASKWTLGIAVVTAVIAALTLGVSYRAFQPDTGVEERLRQQRDQFQEHLDREREQVEWLRGQVDAAERRLADQQAAAAEREARLRGQVEATQQQLADQSGVGSWWPWRLGQE
jgi:Skp family chaperone for outer membrane proteins